MLFPTVEFAVFFAGVFVLAWSVAGRPVLWRAALLIASLLFYASWNYRYLPLLVALALVNHRLARVIERASSRAVARRWVVLAVSVDLGTLLVFKYLAFFTATLVDGLGRAGVRIALTPVQLTLPLGVSFVTFQALSYAIDAYRARWAEAPQTDAVTERAAGSSTRDGPWDVLLYVTFFPHLVAGPIVRAREFLGQIRVITPPSRTEATWAWWLIAGGMLKKVVLSTYLARAIVDPVFAEPEIASAPEILAAIYGYAVQIYADFSGYTDMAIGLAALLGVRFPQNFDQPYRARSLRAFWRRWHMTLSRWLRDYLFVSLGGSRHGPWKTVRNLVLTMLLGGLWHGAAWTFVVWGCLHGAGLALERVAFGARTSAGSEDHPGAPGLRGGARAILATLSTFHFVCVGWVFFRAGSVEDAVTMLRRLAQRAGSDAPSHRITPWLLVAIAAGLALHAIPPGSSRALSDRLARAHPVALGVLLAPALVTADLLSPPGVPPFIYFQF
jgi:alginate O-acetyltransferase complex protein AlgI